MKDFTLASNPTSSILRALASDPKGRASGYFHTYFDHTNINLQALATYPTDEEFNETALEDSQEADSLIALLGIVPNQLHRLQGVSTILPSISSLLANLPAEEDDVISLVTSSSDADDESISEAQELQDLIDGEEDINVSRSRVQDEQMLAVTADESEMADEDIEQIMVEEYHHLCEQRFPQVSDELSKPLRLGGVTFNLNDLDFTPLVEMRRQHQTRQAALVGVRTRSYTGVDVSKLTLKKQIIRRMREVLKEQDNQAVGTGCERSARWGTSGTYIRRT